MQKEGLRCCLTVFRTLKRSVTRLALFAAVQVVFCLWFAIFCAGLVSLGPLRLPYDVPGYWYGGLACLSTAFLPVWVAWTCNEAIDAGAQVSFIEGCGSLADIEKAGQLVHGLKMFAMASKGASPKVTYEQLVSWGYNLITMHFTMGGAIRGMRDIAQKCLAAKSDIPNHEYTEIDKELGGKGFHELFGVNQWLELGKKFNQNIEIAEHLKSSDEQ